MSEDVSVREIVSADDVLRAADDAGVDPDGRRCYNEWLHEENAYDVAFRASDAMAALERLLADDRLLLTSTDFAGLPPCAGGCF